MQKQILLFLLFIYGSVVLGQDAVPRIKATSTSVDIAVGDDLFLKGGWYLEHDKNPDVFSIGSRWPYEHKKVSFITNIDSISFDVEPGKKYNFVILLNDSIPCHIQIATLPDPVFLDSNILLPTGVGFIILIILLYLKRDRLNPFFLIRTGYLLAVLFWAMVFTSGYIHGDYNHLKNVISELGALGTRSEVITSSTLLILAVLSMFFSIGFYKASAHLGLSRGPALLTFSQPVSLAWAAIFPLGNEFHSMTGPLPVLTILASLLAFILWKREKVFFPLRVISLVCFFIMSLIFVRFARPFGMEFEGLVQRFFYIGWTIWIIAISFWFGKLYGWQHSRIKT